MTIATMIYLRDHTERGLLRRRGEQAYQKMSRYFDADEVEINLDGLRSMSMSFIDGIISKLVINEQLDKVHFHHGQRENFGETWHNIGLSGHAYILPFVGTGETRACPKGGTPVNGALKPRPIRGSMCGRSPGLW